MTPAQLIAQLYVGYYNRAPDPSGLGYWVGVFKSGKSLADIANYFAVQEESKASYAFLTNPDFASPSTFIDQIYKNLFNRTPDAEGKSYWMKQLQTGSIKPGAFIATIQNAANSAGAGDDFLTLKNKMQVGLKYAEAILEADITFTPASARTMIATVDKTEASVSAAEAKIDAFVTTGDTTPLRKNFTKEIDQLTGGSGNDIFIANNAMASGADSVDGG